ncbi:GNAT family N-acetyltransferase [Gaetbulibacter aestuarii]|uniref:GNAT family N-acetyltransferase n=1 Tax=Gaetbulibacter aestuarii TaxID=1502358 RepID=A0ABW7MYB3_9FLAO
MTLNIKPATLSDFETVYHFICELEEVSFDKEKMRVIFEENLKSQKIIYLIGSYQNEPAAFLSCHLQNLLHHNGMIAEIQELFILKKFRRKKFGSILIDYLIALLKKKKVFQLEVTSNKVRTETLHFYKSIGFTDSHIKFVKPLI